MVQPAMFAIISVYDAAGLPLAALARACDVCPVHPIQVSQELREYLKDAAVSCPSERLRRKPNLVERYVWANMKRRSV